MNNHHTRAQAARTARRGGILRGILVGVCLLIVVTWAGLGTRTADLARYKSTTGTLTEAPRIVGSQDGSVLTAAHVSYTYQGQPRTGDVTVDKIASVGATVTVWEDTHHNGNLWTSTAAGDTPIATQVGAFFGGLLLGLLGGALYGALHFLAVWRFLLWRDRTKPDTKVTQLRAA